MNVRIQSTVVPPEILSPADWQLYIKVRSVQKVNIIRRLNDKLNRVLRQSINN